MVTFSKLGKGEFGRLGNQLFQIAATLAVAKKNNLDFVFPKWHYSGYFKNELPTGYPDNLKVHKQLSLNYYNILLDNNSNWDLQGFFQSELFFEHEEKTIRYYFEPSNELSNYIKSKYATLLTGKTCSIHIRRGDYLKQSYWFPTQPIEYYYMAIEQFGDDRKFLIFSDDIEWCKSKFKEDNFYFIENENDITDLFLMSFCTDHILSNSSFSWWGAWLNNSPDKKIICPEYWFGPASAFNMKDFSKDIFSKKFQKLILPKIKFRDKHKSMLDPMVFIYFKVYFTGFGMLRFIGRPLKKIISIFKINNHNVI